MDNVGNGNGGGVTFTVKELLGNLDSKLNSVLDKLDGKVDRSLFDLLAHRVEVLEARITDAETARKTAEDVAATLKAKDEEDRSLWEQWRGKVAWCAGFIVIAAQVHLSFPHLHF